MICIRATLEQDLAHLPDLERAAAESFRTIAELAWIADEDVTSAEGHRRYMQAGTSWVIEEDTIESDTPELRGFLYAERFDDALHIWELAVHREHQGRGLGRRLLGHAIDTAMELALAAVTLTTFTEVPWNAPFYARLGFVVVVPITPGSRLAGVVARERALGLPVERRCAMRLDLTNR